MKSVIISIFILFSSLLGVAGKLKLTLKPKNAQGEIEHNSWAFVYENGEKIDMVACDKNSGMLFKLEFDKEYRIELNSKNYETINIFVNTKNLSDANKKYVYEYTSSFDLVEKKPGMKAVYQKGNEAKLMISYNPQKDNFTNTYKYNPIYNYVPIEPEQKPQPEKPKEEEKPKQETSQKPKEEPKKEESKTEESKPENINTEPKVQEPKDSVPEKDTIQKDESTPITAKPIEPVGKPKQKLPVIVKTQNPEHFVEQKQKQKAAKQLRGEMEKARLQFEEEEMKNYYSKAKSKRTFLEEVSDSRILLKQQERNYQPQETNEVHK